MFGRSCSRLLGFALVCAVLVQLPAAVSAQEDSELRRTASASYTVDPAEGRVDARFSYAFENPSGAVAFPGFFESLPIGAVDVAATANGRELVASQTGVDQETSIWFVQFAASLEPGDRIDVELTWALTDTGEPGLLIAPGAVSLDLYAPGTDEDATPIPGLVHISLPETYESLDGHRLLRPDGSGLATFESYPPGYEVVRYQFLATDEFVGDLVDLPPVFAVTTWDGDPAWAATVTDRLTAIGPELDTWFGPLTDEFTVRRTLPAASDPLVDDGLVELVGSDALSVDRQVAHLWLADVPVEEPWFIEGLALGFAGAAGPPGSAEAMIADLVDQLGAAGVRAVVDALRSETSPYPGAIPETRILPADWRTLLDLIERVGGVDDAAAVFRASLTEEGEARFDTAMIDGRAAAVVDYAALEDRAGAWVLPPSMRHAMASWEFEAFTAGQTEVSEVIVERDEIDGWAASLELDARDDARVLFEAAEGDQAETIELLAHQRESLEAFSEAERVVNGDRGLLAAIGLWGSDPDGDLAELRELWAAGDDERLVDDAHELTESVEQAVGRGTIRLLIPALAIIAVWQLLRWLRRRSSWGGEEAAAAVQAENVSP